MDMTNKTKNLLKKGTRAFGTFQCIASVAVSEILAQEAFDWILIDMEHGQMGIETAGALCGAIANGGPTPLIRVPGNDQATIKRALDAGALGVMVPLVNTKEDAIKAVSYSRYPPHGIRGIGPGRASHYGLRLMSYAQKANDEILVIVQAEHKDAVDHIEEIAGVPGIDMIFVGPFDLASSMGHIGQVDHPEVEAAIEKVLRATIRANRIPGIFCMSADMAIKRAKQGFTFIAVGLDSLYLHSGIAGAMDAVEQAF